MIEVNFSDKPKVLVGSAELHLLITKNIRVVTRCVDGIYGAVSANYEDINSTPGMKHHTFKKFFVYSHVSRYRRYDESWVQSAYEYVLLGDLDAPYALIKSLLGEDCKDYLASTKVSLRRGLWLLLVLLFKDGCILLTPLLKANQYKYNCDVLREYGFDYYPELMAFTISARDKISLPVFWKDVDLRVRERVAQYGARLFWIIGARVPEDLTIENLVEVHKKYFYEGERLTAELPVHTIIYFVCMYFGGRVRFTYQELYEALNDLRPVRYKSGARGELTAIDFAPIMAQSESSDKLVDYCRLLVRAQFMPARVLHNPILAESGFDHGFSLVRWVEVEKLYLKGRPYEEVKHSAGGIAFLNIYLFVYLDKWFKLFSSDIFTYPKYVSQLDVSFVAPAIVNDGAPLPLKEFLNRMTNETPAARYAAFQQLKAMFSWLEQKGIKDEKGKFVNYLSKSDMPPSAALPASNKRPFKRVEYGIAINYLYCIFLALKILNEDILESNYTDISHGSLEQRAAELGWVNEFYYAGRKYVVESLPKCFFRRWRFPSYDGVDVTIFSPHQIVHILAAVESGLRHQSIQWLCTGFDQLVIGAVEVNKPYWLHVVADKTVKKPIKTIVSGQTILALRYQKEVRSMVAAESFKKPKSYENRQNNTRDDYLPLFSKALESGDPYADGVYAEAYMSFLVSYQHFLKASQMSCKFYELKPKGVGFGEEVIPNQVEVFNVAAPYCPIRFVTDMTPHHTRNSTVKIWQRIISDSEVGKFKTGQGVRTVRYYGNLIDEDYDEIKVKISDGLNGVWKGERLDPSLPESSYRRALSADISQALRDFNCITMAHAASANSPSVLEDLKRKYGDSVSHHATHICTMGDVCPQSLVDDGLAKRCGLCIFSVKGIDNIPAMNVKIYNMSLEVEELHSYADSVPETNVNELERIDERLEQTVADLLGWTWCRDYLVECYKRDSQVSGKLISTQPELLKKSMREVEMGDESIQYVFSMLYENSLYPELQSDVARAKYNFLKLSLIGGNISVSDIFKPVSYDSASLIVTKVKSILLSSGVALHELLDKLAANNVVLLDDYSPLILTDSVDSDVF